MKIPKGLPVQNQVKIEAQFREAAKMYETHFLNEMVKSMRKTVDRENGWIEPSFGEKIFSEQLDSQYVDGWTAKGGIGLADLIYNHLAERYLPQGRMTKRLGSLPLEGAEAAKPLPTQNPQSAKFRIQTAPKAEGEPQTGILAPNAGKVALVESLGDEWWRIGIDHLDGQSSHLTFNGRVANLEVGESVVSGQRLGQVARAAPVVDWELNWT